jgi:hypothetical protein
LPGSHYSFSNWISTPDAKWGLFASNPIQQHPIKGQYTGSQWFAMKIPPSPSSDTVTRAAGVPIYVTLTGVSGDTVRIALGYAENGNPASYYCTTRLEACYTTSAPTTTAPFLFASDTQAYTTCSSGCTIPVPAIPGRKLYYQVHRKNGSNEIVGPLQSVEVP